MDKEKINQSFLDYLKGKGFDEKSLSLKFLPDLFIDFYRDVEFPDFDKDEDADMLLFQYGKQGLGKEVSFYVDFTRQLYEVFEEDDGHEICQLSVTFLYEPKAFENFEASSLWSTDCADLEEFKAVVINSSAYKLALTEQPVRQEIILGLV